MEQFVLSEAQVTQFHNDGFVIVERLFNTEEIELIRKIAHTDHALTKAAVDRHDLKGNITRLALRNELGDDVYSAVTRCERIVASMERLLGDEVYHYHHKMNMKEPLVGGAWEWHQDYGYWYNNGCLYPDMGSCMIAVDKATRQNGCLQAVKGSHKLGRIAHGKTADQTGADLERMEEILKRLEVAYCEMEAGSAVFFHANTLHRSDANLSPTPRWALICCYNTKHNDPYKKHHHPNYAPLERWADERVAEAGRRELAAMEAQAL
jgi:hypothetical protein